MRLRDTIAAISTPPGRGGLGVVRISGAEALSIANQLLHFAAPPQPRRATLAQLHSQAGDLIDEVITTYFAAPRSFTGEDVVEVSCHGSPVILEHCLERAMAAGARMAEPGEFTLRAFLNGRIDLPRAEAVRDLIEATTLYQAKIAAQQTQGSVSKRLHPIKTQLLELIALLEAGIDFAEDDIGVAPTGEILRRLDPILRQTSDFAESHRYGNLVRHGFSLAIVGAPNAGKSSLFNRLLRRERAIVTDIPGTTRDLVSETAEFEGIPVRLVDTAGIRETSHGIEKLGIQKSHEAMADADLTLVVLDGSRPTSGEEQEILRTAERQGRFLAAVNKCDVPGFTQPGKYLAVSALTGQGVPELREKIRGAVLPGAGPEPQGGFLTSMRHKLLLDECAAMLRKAQQAAHFGLPHELLLLDLYCALQAMDGITGATTADEILNRIFSSFCIGK